MGPERISILADLLESPTVGILTPGDGFHPISGLDDLTVSTWQSSNENGGLQDREYTFTVTMTDLHPDTMQLLFGDRMTAKFLAERGDKAVSDAIRSDSERLRAAQEGEGWDSNGEYVSTSNENFRCEDGCAICAEVTFDELAEQHEQMIARLVDEKLEELNKAPYAPGGVFTLGDLNRATTDQDEQDEQDERSSITVVSEIEGLTETITYQGDDLSITIDGRNDLTIRRGGVIHAGYPNGTWIEAQVN